MAKETEAAEAEREARYQVMASEAQQIISGIEKVDDLNLSLFRAKPFGNEKNEQPRIWEVWVETLSRNERVFVTQSLGFFGRILTDPKTAIDNPRVTVGAARALIARGDVDWRGLDLLKTFAIKALTPLEK